MIFNRKAELIIANKKYTLDTIDIDFTVEFDSFEEVIVQDIYIYNLSANSRNAIQKGDNVILNAGYENDIGSIVIGNIYDISISKNNTDIETKLLVISNIDRWASLSISKSYVGGTRASFIIRDLLGGFGLEIGEITLVNDLVYRNGYVANGMLKNVINSIVRECGSNMCINNNQIFIRRPFTGIQTGFVLSGETGLIGSPTKVQVEEKEGYKVDMLLNHRINVNSAIQIKSSIVSGNFLVVKGTHSGDFITSVEVLPL